MSSRARGQRQSTPQPQRSPHASYSAAAASAAQAPPPTHVFAACDGEVQTIPGPTWRQTGSPATSLSPQHHLQKAREKVREATPPKEPQALKRSPPIPFASNDSDVRSDSPTPRRAASPASPKTGSPGATVRAPKQQSPLPRQSSDARPLAGRALPSAQQPAAAPLVAKHSAPPALSVTAAAAPAGGANMRAAAAAQLPSPTSATAMLQQQQARQASASGMSDTSQSGGAALAQLGHYQLGDCLGRGAFGSVFRGLNWITGETVAVKQIRLGNIPASELGEIMSEIDLLRCLNHPNIVKYKGSEKTRDYLYIILEYCENGSLQHICKRFGKFPEGLVGVYVSQMLEGLLYLHDQGVIHRDIKGANILTTKDGSVKLADFGVATRTGAMADYAVVGSPYWMAPEVIDQSGASTASDIWSVGCVVIELLEGKPPYHQLDPMPALFRIVQDDCPPLPESASPVVKDFLMLCFQKDANLRVSARKLLRHPWMMNSRRQLEGMHKGGSLRGQGTATVYDEAVKSVQEWNEALRDPPGPLAPRGPVAEASTIKPASLAPPGGPLGAGRWPTSADQTDSSLAPHQRTPTRRTARSVSRPLPAGMTSDNTNLPAPSRNSDPDSTPKSNDAPFTGLPVSLGSPKVVPVLPPLHAAPLLEQRKTLMPEAPDDNWDDDFEEGISSTKISSFDKPEERAPKASEAKAEMRRLEARPAASPLLDASNFDLAESNEDNFVTIKPKKRDSSPASPPSRALAGPSHSGRSPTAARSPRAAPAVLPKLDEASASADVEDYSDLVSDDEENHLDERIRKLQAQHSVGRRLFHPNDLKALSAAGSASSSGAPPLGRRGSSGSDRSPGGTMRPVRQLSSPSIAAIRDRSDSPTSSLSPPGSVKLSDEKWKSVRRTLSKYSEGGGEDYSDLFGKTGTSEGSSSATPTLQLTTRLSNRSWLGDDEDDDDPFAEIDGELADQADLESNLARDKHARNAAEVTKLVDALQDASIGEDELIETCYQLELYMTQVPEMKAVILSAHGALAIVQLLELSRADAVTFELLGLLNILIFDESSAQETLCLIGAIPVVMALTAKKHSPDVRLEAAHFIYCMCDSSSLTLQFVLSCRGLKTLVGLIDEDYAEEKALVCLGIACVNSVLGLQSQASRNDFCRMLAQEGLMEPLSEVLAQVIEDDAEPDEETPDYVLAAKDRILQIFIVFSSSTRGSWLKERVATRGVLRRMMQACHDLDPKSLTLMLKSIKSLSMSPPILDELQNANTIEALTRVLAQHHDGPWGNEVSNQVLNTMYNLCRLNKSRQEEAAQAGIIPELLRIVRNKSHLKQFALPILCDFAHAKVTRKLMNQHGGIDFYLDLLEDPAWRAQALDAVYVWLQEDSRVEAALLRPESTAAILSVFTTTATASSFENLLAPFTGILRLSPSVALAVGTSANFLKRLIKRLGHAKAVVRLNLLRITKLVCDAHPDGQSFIEQYKLLEIIERLSRDDGAVLVRELARDILEQLRASPDQARSVRRTASETHIGSPSAPSTVRRAARPPVDSGPASGRASPARSGASLVRRQTLRTQHGAAADTPSQRSAAGRS